MKSCKLQIWTLAASFLAVVPKAEAGISLTAEARPLQSP
jgi:hypothetical protein